MYHTTGVTACDQMIDFHIEGNIIPHIWYKTIVKPTKGNPDKPHLLAILLLADIVYWYRPALILDESTGELLGYKKKFRCDLLQRSYENMAETYACSKDTVKAAIVFLEKDLHVIYREFRNTTINGTACNNIMYIGLNVDRLRELTYPTGEEAFVSSCAADNAAFDTESAQAAKNHPIATTEKPSHAEEIPAFEGAGKSPHIAEKALPSDVGESSHIKENFHTDDMGKFPRNGATILPQDTGKSSRTNTKISVKKYIYRIPSVYPDKPAIIPEIHDENDTSKDEGLMCALKYNLLINHIVPLDCQIDYQKAEYAVRQLTDYDSKSQTDFSSNYEYTLYQNAVESLTEMVCENQPKDNRGNVILSGYKVIEKINEIISQEFDLSGVLTYIISDFKEADLNGKEKIRNRKRYLKAVISDCLSGYLNRSESDFVRSYTEHIDSFSNAA